MNARNTHVTNGGWGTSSTSGGNIPGHQINIYKLHEGYKFKDNQFRIQKGDLDGTIVPNREMVTQLCMYYGYNKKYGRNTCQFVMSRAARKRGMTTDNWMYMSCVKRHAERLNKV